MESKLDLAAHQLAAKANFDDGWPGFYAQYKANHKALRSPGDVERAVATYATRCSDAKAAMRKSCGHATKDAYRLGYMLLQVQESHAYSLESLERVKSLHWDMLADPEDVITRVKDAVSGPCHFGRAFYEAELAYCVSDSSSELRKRRLKLESFQNTTADGFQAPQLGHLDLQVLLCAETWCTWAKRGGQPLSSNKPFIELFGANLSKPVRIFVKNLEAAYKSEELGEYICSHYGQDTIMLEQINALTALGKDL